MKSRTTKLLMAAAAATATVAGIALASKRPKYSGVKLKTSITIDRPAAELYAFWRNLENLPKLTEMLDSVKVLDGRRSEWTVTGPGGVRGRWEAEKLKELENEMIAWRSTEGSKIETAGYVRFEPATGGRGTVVRLALEYDLPAAKIGTSVASLFQKQPAAYIEELLHRFKQLMETGEIAVARERPHRQRRCDRLAGLRAFARS